MHDLYDIERVVPHRGTMRLVDRLVAWDEDSVAVELRVPHEGPFSHAEGVPAWVGVEYMAQAVAAWAGWQAVQAQQPVKLGFLLGTRKYQAHCSHFAPGMVLEVQVRSELIGENGLGMFECQIRQQDNEQVLAQARISVYEPEDGSAYIRALEKQEVSEQHE